jgi:hypothetical protein
VNPEAVAEAYHAFEQGSGVAPLTAAAISNQTIQESMRLLLLVRAYQVRGFRDLGPGIGGSKCTGCSGLPTCTRLSRTGESLPAARGCRGCVKTGAPAASGARACAAGHAGGRGAPCRRTAARLPVRHAPNS